MGRLVRIAGWRWKHKTAALLTSLTSANLCPTLPKPAGHCRGPNRQIVMGAGSKGAAASTTTIATRLPSTLPSTQRGCPTRTLRLATTFQPCSARIIWRGPYALRTPREASPPNDPNASEIGTCVTTENCLFPTDCANFTSIAMWYGGLPMTDRWFCEVFPVPLPVLLRTTVGLTPRPLANQLTSNQSCQVRYGRDSCV